MLLQAKRARRDEREKKREKLGDNAAPKQTPRTIENTREPDETMLLPDDDEVGVSFCSFQYLHTVNDIYETLTN